MGSAYDWNREEAAPRRRSSAAPPLRTRRMEVPVRTRRPAQTPPDRGRRGQPAPPPAACPRQSAKRAARRERARYERGLAMLALMLAVVVIGAAGRILSDARTAAGIPPGGPSAPGQSAASLPPGADGQGLAANNTGPIEVPDWVDQRLLPLNQYSRPGDALPQVNGVVVHYTGNPGTTAEQNRSYFANLAQSGETYASSHFVVGMDGAVVQCVPLDEIAYCSTTRNGDTIAIECCHPDEEGQFTRETVDALVRLLDWLIETYDLERDDVIRHYDVAGKECPVYYVRHPQAWEDLLDKLTFPT